MTTKMLGRPRTSETRDLREDLLHTSRELLDEGGPAALSMQGVARRADCTHQTPYHYFADRETILATLVEAGFDELANRLCEARDKAGTEDLRAVVEASENVYVEFTLISPRVFRVVFCHDICNPARFPGILAAGKRARDELGRFVRTITGERATPKHKAALWADVHGLAVLLLSGLMADELPTLRYQLAYARRVNQPGAGAPMSSGKGEERDDSGAWF